MGPSNVGHSALPHTYISTILPGPSFSFRPYVLQIKQKVGPLTFKYSSPNTNNKISLSLHLIKPTHWPTESLLPFTSYSFVLSSLIHFHLHWYRCLPAPKTPVLCPYSPKKNHDQFFLSSSAFFWNLVTTWWLMSFLLFLKY